MLGDQFSNRHAHSITVNLAKYDTSRAYSRGTVILLGVTAKATGTDGFTLVPGSFVIVDDLGHTFFSWSETDYMKDFYNESEAMDGVVRLTPLRVGESSTGILGFDLPEYSTSASYWLKYYPQYGMNAVKIRLDTSFTRL